MRGDFTRGHRPDQKRGRNYRRVLLQQGRLLLDSDFNALVDAHDELLRDLSRDTACLAGSPDLGYLVTAGRLLALFDELDGIEANVGGFELYRDYSHKYLDRYPSLYLGNSSGAAVTVSIPLRAESAGEIHLWMRSDGVSNVAVEGIGLAVNTPDFTPHLINPPSTDSLDISLPNGQEVWLALVERHQEAGTLPSFWAAAGRFHVDGLMVEIPEDGPYSDLHFDPAEGFQIADLEVDDGGLRPLEAGDRVLAYLEAFERHITHVEDRGVLEEALGGGDDTCTRSQALCQVKVAAAGNLSPEDLRRAVRGPVVLDGTLEVTTALGINDPDPCALPVAGGYRGTDNRLYRFEVHRGGPLAETLFKWSRDNGSELFRARDVTVAGPTITQLIFAPECPLESGDLVEVLDEPHERGDQAFATIDEAAATFTPPERAVGRLVRLHAAAGPVDGKTFDLSEPDDDSLPVALTDFGAPPDPLPKVRRWHGLIEPGGGADPFQAEVEDGIEIEVTGTFRAGDWWQYEARARRGNDNGPFQTSPHGPERLFAPLGLFEYRTAAEPLELVAWLDERFPSLCGICADDVCFDGERVGAEECDTVQEALEKLFEQEPGEGGGGCCDVTLEPQAGGDDAARIQELLNQADGDLTICLRPGIYRLESVVVVSERCLTLVGCPDALLVSMVGDGVGPFVVTEGGRLRLRDLILFAPLNEQAPVLELITLTRSGDGFEAEEVALILAGPGDRQVAIRAQNAEPLPFDPTNPARSLEQVPTFPEAESPSISLRDSIVIAGWAIVAESIADLEVRSSAFFLTAGGISAGRILSGQVLDNSWIVGVSRDLTASWSAAQLASEPKRLLDGLAEAVGPLRGATAEPGGVVGWVVQTLVLGTFERNVVVASLGAVVGRFQACQWADNLFQASSYGIDLAEANNSSLTRELLSLTQEAVGIQVFSASRFTVRDCLVVLAGIGIRLGGDEQVGFDSDGQVVFTPRPAFPAAALAPRLESVQVVGNRAVAQIGLQLGSAGVGGFFGQVEEVSIRQNQVEAEVGFLLRGPLDSFEAPNQVIVDGNDLRCSGLAIDLAGAGITLSSNSVTLSGQVPYAAIQAFQAPRLVIEGNSISGQLGPDGFGMLCQDSSLVRIQDNHFALGEGNLVLYLLNAGEARVIDNDFGFGGIFLDRCDRSTLQGNQASSAQIRRCDGGTVRGNSVSFDLQAVTAQGRWQIEDNQAGGRLQLVPDVVTGPASGGGLVVTDQLGVARRGDWAVAALAFLGAEEGEVEPEVQPNRRLLGSVRGSEERAAISFAAENPGWRDVWAAAALDEIDHLLFAELDQLEAEVVFLSPLFELPYHAQLVGNWANEIQVGHASNQEGVTPSRETVVQVVGNRADNRLDVLPYVHAVASANAASFLTPWIARQTNVNTPNIQF